MNAVKMNGPVTAVFALGNTVQIWVSSPTGDSSDSQIFEITCLTEEQAEIIAGEWKSVWKL